MRNNEQHQTLTFRKLEPTNVWHFKLKQPMIKTVSIWLTNWWGLLAIVSQQCTARMLCIFGKVFMSNYSYSTHTGLVIQATVTASRLILSVLSSSPLQPLVVAKAYLRLVATVRTYNWVSAGPSALKLLKLHRLHNIFLGKETKIFQVLGVFTHF